MKIINVKKCRECPYVGNRSVGLLCRHPEFNNDKHRFGRDLFNFKENEIPQWCPLKNGNKAYKVYKTMWEELPKAIVERAFNDELTYVLHKMRYLEKKYLGEEINGS